MLNAKVDCETFFDGTHKTNESYKKGGSIKHKRRREKFTEVCENHGLEIATKQFVTLATIYHESPSSSCRLSKETETMSTYISEKYSSNLDHFVIGYCTKKENIDEQQKIDPLIDPETGICQRVEITAKTVTSKNCHRLCIATLAIKISSKLQNSQDGPPAPNHPPLTMTQSSILGTRSISNIQSQDTKQEFSSVGSSKTQSSSSSNLTDVAAMKEAPSSTTDSNVTHNTREPNAHALAPSLTQMKID